MTDNGDADPARAEEEGEFENEEALLKHFERYTESRAAIPWSERTRLEKVSYYLDRMFLGFICLVVLLFVAEFAYKMWYVTSGKAIYKFVVDIVTYFFTQEEDEELIEL